MKKTPKPKPQDPMGPTDRVYVVKYRMPGDEGRNPRRMTVNAINQTDAVKAAKMTVPGAKVIGGPQELDEGLVDFAKAIGKFLSRCVGRGCLKYAKSRIKGDPDTIRYIRKLTTRDLAKRAGEGLVRMGGGDPGDVRMGKGRSKSSNRKPRKSRKPRAYKPKKRDIFKGSKWKKR